MQNRGPQSTNAGFGFFISNEDESMHLQGKYIVKDVKSSTWNEGVRNLGYTFLGHNPAHSGFGVVFMLSNENKAPEPNISCVTLPVYGLVAGVNFPRSGSDDLRKKMDFRNQPLEFQVRVNTSYKVLFRAAGTSAAWEQLCEVSNVPRMDRSYFGWSGYSGDIPSSFSKADMSVTIGKLETYNFVNVTKSTFFFN